MAYDYNQFVLERDEALLSLDKMKIIAYCKKYGIPVVKEEEVFWAGIHKAILQIKSATDAQKQRSYDWLIAHKFSPDIY